jgi:hypothetical protein
MKSFISKVLNSRVAVTAIIFLMIFGVAYWGYNKYQSIEQDLEIAKQNQLALRDSVRVSKNKIGQLEYSKQILVAKNESDVKKLNDRLAEVKGRFTGKISQLTETIANIKSDTVFVEKTKLVELPDNTKAFVWDYERVYDERNYRFISGETRFKLDTTTNAMTAIGTKITRDIIKFNIIQGLRTTEEGNVEMFASSDYPNFEVKELNSVLIDPSTHPALKKFTKKRKLRFGFYTGAGATINLSNYNVIFGPQIGFGLTF